MPLVSQTLRQKIIYIEERLREQDDATCRLRTMISEIVTSGDVTKMLKEIYRLGIILGAMSSKPGVAVSSEEHFFKGSPFKGIISGLRKECEGNVHRKGAVTITASSNGALNNATG